MLGGSRRTKPCVFPCEVSSVGDGSYLLCATHAAAVVSTAIGSSSSPLCSLVADRIVMAASRLLGATAACVILLPFAAGHRKSYWNGCIKAATMICQQIFSILALLLFLLNFLLKSASNSCFFCFAVKIRFWSYNF